MAREDRDTILLESADIISNVEHAGAQHIVRLHVPRIAARALPGQFIHSVQPLGNENI